jgi:hypothetical protein
LAYRGNSTVAEQLSAVRAARMTVSLPDLPRFTVITIGRPEQNGDSIIVGRISPRLGVRSAGGCLYRKAGPSIPGRLARNPLATDEDVEFCTPDASLAPELEPGASYPWIDLYWQSYHIDMILAGEWNRREFVATEAHYFRLQGITGWQEVGTTLPLEAEDLGVRAGSWDHEHCELCRRSIRAGSESHGYVTPSDRWICEPCYERYAAGKDLSFILEE